MIIMTALSMLLSIVFFNVVLGASFFDHSVSGRVDTSFGINSISGAIAIISTLVVLAILAGVRILASGLSETSIRTIIIIVGYIGLWTVFSVLAINLIFAIELFGTLIYVGLTVLYAVGVLDKLSNG